VEFVSLKGDVKEVDEVKEVKERNETPGDILGAALGPLLYFLYFLNFLYFPP
jgi:hypothetical protein